MSEQSLEYQLELLEELNDYILSFIANLDDFRAEYVRKVGDFRDAGMITNHHEYFRENVFDPRERQLIKLIHALEERDLTLIREEIYYVEAEIERLQQEWDGDD